jgi:hypothetical protein
LETVIKTGGAFMAHCNDCGYAQTYKAGALVPCPLHCPRCNTRIADIMDLAKMNTKAYFGPAMGHPSHDPRQGRVAIPAEVKPTNPKQAYGDKKPPVHLIHQIAELHESAALHSGRRKYGENNYIATEVEAMTYVGAMLRHIKAWVSGERVDPKELVHHLGAVKACATILLTCEATGMMVDNRPVIGGQDVQFQERREYRTATAEALKEVEATIEHLNKLYPSPK